VRHPDWLHKKMLEKEDVLKQRKMNEFFNKKAPPEQGVVFTAIMDVEDAGGNSLPSKSNRPTVNRKRKRMESEFSEETLALSWREALGTPPPYGITRVSQSCH